MKNSRWTAEQTAELKRLATSGFTFEQIAQKLDMPVSRVKSKIYVLQRSSKYSAPQITADGGERTPEEARKKLISDRKKRVDRVSQLAGVHPSRAKSLIKTFSITPY